MLQFVNQLPILLPPILLALSFHEWAHAWTANRLGDPTARLQGRLSLNPLVHLDPLGTLALILTQRFGWAKPVPVDTRYLKHPKRDMFWIASAGPIANLAQALLLGTIIRLVGHRVVENAWYSFRFGTQMSVVDILLAMLYLGFAINILLAWFNLIPIPPLDGSKLVLRFLSPEAAVSYMRYSRFGMLILLCLIFIPAFQGTFLNIMRPPVLLTGHIFGGISIF